MNYRFAAIWLKGFMDSADAVCSLYTDDALFEDLLLDQSISDPEDLQRSFGPFANTDAENGFGIHRFGLAEFNGTESAGLVRWHWTATDAAAFLGLPAAGRTITTDGQSFHVYRDGKIASDSTFWDAVPVLNTLGYEVSGTVCQLPGGGRAPRSSGPGIPALGSGEDRATAWTEALGDETDQVVGMYADEFIYSDGHEADADATITDRQVLHERLAPFANQDPSNGAGRHNFEVTEWRGDERSGVILWQWSGQDLASYRGIPTDGVSLATQGQTWHEYDDDGYIVRECTKWNDVPVFKALGLPLITPHYWEADFDPAQVAS